MQTLQSIFRTNRTTNRSKTNTKTSDHVVGAYPKYQVNLLTCTAVQHAKSSKRWIRVIYPPKVNNSAPIVINPNLLDAAGSVPVTNETVKWTMGRKLNLTIGEKSKPANPTDPDVGNLFINTGSWIPFIATRPSLWFWASISWLLNPLIFLAVCIILSQRESLER